MDCVDVGHLGGADHLWNVQVAFAAARWTDADGFVGKTHVKRVTIGFGIDRDGADVELLARGKDAQCNFPSVGNQDFSEHGVWAGVHNGPQVSGSRAISSRLGGCRTAAPRIRAASRSRRIPR